MKKVNRFISMLLLIFMVLTMDLNGYSQIVKAATTNLVEKEAGENLIITSFTADKKSPQATGTQVTLTAKATGEGTLQYKFLIKDLSTGNWYKLRDFSTSNTYVWKTSAVGNKMLYVDVKDVNENVVRKEMSYVVKEKLTELQNKYSDKITDVRNAGLLIGIQLEDSIAKTVFNKLFENKMLTSLCGGNTIRIAPPLIIKETDIDLFINTLSSILEEL